MRPRLARVQPPHRLGLGPDAVAADTYINSNNRATTYGNRPALLIGNGSSALIRVRSR